jgi:transcriptional regulator with XRE-family HTH domain
VEHNTNHCTPNWKELQVRTQIRTARKDAHLTQVALARAVGVTARAVQKWEAGKAEPRAAILKEIALATGKDLAYFFEPAEVAA